MVRRVGQRMSSVWKDRQLCWRRPQDGEQLRVSRAGGGQELA